MGLFKRKSKEQKRLIETIKSESINMEGLFGNIENMAKLQELAKDLCAIAHPDRFSDPSKQEIAKHLFQEIQANKYNYDGLVRVKQKIEEKLLK